MKTPVSQSMSSVGVLEIWQRLADRRRRTRRRRSERLK
jgi:hypothetical protein